MATNPYVNKVVYDGTTLIDLSSDTLSSADQLAQGIVAHDRTGAVITGTATRPTGNINITQAGQTDVTQYATATVPTASYYTDLINNAFYTENNQRKWHIRPRTDLDVTEGDVEGWIGQGTQYGDYYEVNAVPANTTITPSTSAQTVGGQNYMMEGAVTVSAMPTGTAGTPTATKVVDTIETNVTITPSVTNTAGYISGGTITGSPIVVGARELVSGNTVTADDPGNWDVADCETLVIPAGTAGTPSASKGSVSNHAISVTPSVTNTTGWIAGSTKTGTAVTVSASELVSGSQTITQNGTVDVTNLASVTVDVQGGGGSGMTVATAATTPSTANASIQFTGLSGEPTSFVVTSASDLATGASPYKTAAVVFDGTDLHGQIVTNTSNANASYSTSFTKSYSNGTLTITGSGTNFQANQYKLVYTYGGNSANLGTAETQVGSGATSVTFTGLTDEPDYFSVIFKSNFSTSSGYQRVMAVAYDGTNTYGVAMDSGAKALSSWSYTYNNGSLTVTSTGTNNGGYFHQPGYYQLTYGVGGTVEPIEIDVVPLSVTTNGTYTAPSGTAYSPVTVNVSGGGSNVVEGTFTASTTKGEAQTVNIPYTGNGYPIFAHIEVDGGTANPNTAWYTTVQRYAVGLWCMSKRLQSTSPDYSDNTEKNQSIVMEVHKNSTSNATTLAISGGATANIFTTSAASAYSASLIRFSSKNTMSVFVASTSYGLMSGVTYRYQIQYSS